MRMKMVCDDRMLREIANEFLAVKKAQKIRDRTLSDYRKYIDKFLAQSENSLNVEILKTEIWISLRRSLRQVRHNSITLINTFILCLNGAPNKTTSPTTPSTSLNWKKFGMMVISSPPQLRTYKRSWTLWTNTITQNRGIITLCCWCLILEYGRANSCRSGTKTMIPKLCPLSSALMLPYQAAAEHCTFPH